MFETQVQIRIVYATAVIVPVSTAEWDALSEDQRNQLLWKTGQDPNNLFSAGDIDINDPAKIEYLDAEPFEG